MKRALWSIALILGLAAAAPFFPANILRPRVAAALEQSLGRPVEIGAVRFTFFPSGPLPGPGFTLENVTIHEDPRAGIEPFAHMADLGASVRLLSLLRGKLELSGINLGDATINLVKTAAGPWNFQFLLEHGASGSPDRGRPLPAVRMRAGRVNFKFADTKSAFYFNDADLDIAPAAVGAVDLRFGGAPSRTDRSRQDFGRFFISGDASSQKLDLRVELESSSLDETLRLMDPRGFGVHGVVALDARISGEPSELNVAGNVQVGDIHRWDLLPSAGDSLRLPFTGTLDLRGERLELTSPSKPVSVQFKAWDLLKTPAWEATADFQQMPLATLFEIGRHMGATLPENLTVAGSVSGTAHYNQRNGLSGQLTLGEASLTLPDREPVQAAEAHLSVVGAAVRLAPALVRIGPEETARIDGLVTLAEPHALDLTINTRGLSVAALQSFGLTAIPIIQQTPQGVWKGWARYRETPPSGDPAALSTPLGTWSGESELRDARIRLDGLADPVEIESATVSLRGRRVAVERIRASAGAAQFTGSYNFDPAAPRPHRFNLVMEEADAAELERLLAPTLARASRGFIARTLRFSAPPPPAWLANRRAEGTLRIDSLAAGPWKLTGLRAAFEWEGLRATLTGTGAADGPTFDAGLEIDLSAPAPKYELKGSLTGLAYRDGRLQLAGTLVAHGDPERNAARLLESVRGEVTVKPLGNTPAPAEDFRIGAASLQLQPAANEPLWKLSIAPESW